MKTNCVATASRFVVRSVWALTAAVGILSVCGAQTADPVEPAPPHGAPVEDARSVRIEAKRTAQGVAISLIGDLSSSGTRMWQDRDGFHLSLPDTRGVVSQGVPTDIKFRYAGDSLEVLIPVTSEMRIEMERRADGLHLLVRGVGSSGAGNRDAPPEDAVGVVSGRRSYEPAPFSDPAPTSGASTYPTPSTPTPLPSDSRSVFEVAPSVAPRLSATPTPTPPGASGVRQPRSQPDSQPKTFAPTEAEPSPDSHLPAMLGLSAASGFFLVFIRARSTQPAARDDRSRRVLMPTPAVEPERPAQTNRIERRAASGKRAVERRRFDEQIERIARDIAGAFDKRARSGGVATAEPALAPVVAQPPATRPPSQVEARATPCIESEMKLRWLQFSLTHPAETLRREAAATLEALRDSPRVGRRAAAYLAAEAGSTGADFEIVRNG